MPGARTKHKLVLAACFAGLPDVRFLADALAGLSVKHVQSRTRVVLRAVADRPALIVIPSIDGRGVPTAPLVRRCRALAPDVKIVSFVLPQPGLARAMRQASLSGAHAVCVTSAE